jgi:hypothetical protein
MSGVFRDPYGVTLKGIQCLGIDSELMEIIELTGNVPSNIERVPETLERFWTLLERFR